MYQVPDASSQRSKSMFNPMGFNFDGSPPKLAPAKPVFEECKIFQDDSSLILVRKDEDSYQVVCSVNYKNIIEMQEYMENDNYNKYNLKASNTLQIRYVKNYQQYQNYIITKWKALEYQKQDTYGLNGFINGTSLPYHLDPT